jgi:large subunit ribosomal protein L33
LTPGNNYGKLYKWLMIRRVYFFRLFSDLLTRTRLLQEVIVMREGITLACVDCKNRNYRTNKNKKNDPERLEIMKYCKFCRKETTHKETK